MVLLEQQLASSLQAYRQAPRWLVAYSGGVDSHLLLHLLSQLRRQDPSLPPLLAVHVNHQLQAQAADWARHCQQQCEQLGVPLLLQTVTVSSGPRQSLEAQAREARYQAFEQILQPGDVLLQGHHLDDQAETVLLRLLRGSGCAGMAAMPGQRPLGSGRLLRPLLSCSRQQIVAAAEQAGLSWIEDPSNRCTDLARNYLRQQVLPLLEQRWPGYRHTMARSSALLAESQQLNRELAQLDAERLQLSLQAGSLSLQKFQQLNSLRRKNLLRCWLTARGLPVPTAQQLQQLLDEVLAARADAQPLLCWAGLEARRFDGELYVMSALAPVDTEWSQEWQGQALMIPGSGRLSATAVSGAGLRVQPGLQLRLRRGGERCRPQGRAHSQSLKKLFQEYAVPPWLRARVPLLYCGDQLVAVAGYWVCEGFQAAAGEPGWQLDWQPVAAREENS